MKWRTVKLPESVIARLDDLVKERGRSRARVLAELFEEPRPERAEMAESEFRECLEAGVRRGTVGAMQLWASLYRREEKPAVADPFDEARERKLKVIRGGDQPA